MLHTVPKQAQPPWLLALQVNGLGPTAGAAGLLKTSWTLPGAWGPTQLSGRTACSDLSPGAIVIEGSAITQRLPWLSVRIQAYVTVPPTPLVVNQPIVVTVIVSHFRVGSAGRVSGNSPSVAMAKCGRGGGLGVGVGVGVGEGVGVGLGVGVGVGVGDGAGVGAGVGAG